VVGCDGRSSGVRQWCNFNIRRDADRLTIAGVLLDGGTGYRARRIGEWQNAVQPTPEAADMTAAGKARPDDCCAVPDGRNACRC
jgi:hypothetical protein